MLHTKYLDFSPCSFSEEDVYRFSSMSLKKKKTVILKSRPVATSVISSEKKTK